MTENIPQVPNNATTSTIDKIEIAENEVTKQISSKIKFLRNLSSISQSDLAKLLGVSFQQVQKYEKGLTKITAAKLCMIASIFNVDLSFFFKDAKNIREIPEPIKTDRNVMEDIKFISGYFEKTKNDKTKNKNDEND